MLYFRKQLIYASFFLRPVLRKHFIAMDRLDEQFMICIQWYLDTWLAFEIFRWKAKARSEFIALKCYEDIYTFRIFFRDILESQ